MSVPPFLAKAVGRRRVAEGRARAVGQALADNMGAHKIEGEDVWFFVPSSRLHEDRHAGTVRFVLATACVAATLAAPTLLSPFVAVPTWLVVLSVAASVAALAFMRVNLRHDPVGQMNEDAKFVAVSRTDFVFSDFERFLVVPLADLYDAASAPPDAQDPPPGGILIDDYGTVHVQDETWSRVDRGLRPMEGGIVKTLSDRIAVRHVETGRDQVVAHRKAGRP